MRHCFASQGSPTLLTRGEPPAISSIPGQKHQQSLGRPSPTCSSPRQAQHKWQSLRVQASAWEAVASPQGGLVRLFQQDAGGHLGGRKVLAEVKIHASVSQVWSVLTDYERLPEFVPNLESCEREPCRRVGRTRLRQRGCSQSLFWRLEAEAVLEVEEAETGGGQREIRFHLVEGDFKDFRGRWVVEPDSSVRNATDVATVLRYEVVLVPHWSIPSTIMSCVVKAGLPANLIAVAQQAEQLAAQRRQATPRFAAQALREPETPSLPFMPRMAQPSLESLPAKGPARGMLAELAPEPPTIRLSMPKGGGKAAKFSSVPSAEARSAYLGLTSVPIPASTQDPNGQIAARQRARESLRASYPAFGTPHVEGVSEVHLRRLDGPSTLHRRAVAVIKINASCAEVSAWAGTCRCTTHLTPAGGIRPPVKSGAVEVTASTVGLLHDTLLG
ncbi:hypothetical protein WJX84_003842 [Apatococcus fuscideae]|uniref:Coenzyme Q-binding protein COQ10 START domain-containing protein n=1 Tax=Apatococcus fuscideae TaxID=2026836 RepID=A0AAW1T2T8_9CHLO